MACRPVSECDLVIRGGTVATAGGSAECDLGISQGRIRQIGGVLRGRREIDATGALVLPGGLDMHVHLSSPEPPEPGVPAWVDDFASGSAAAIAGGVTTIGNMTFPGEGQSLRQALARDLEAASGAAAVDYVLHPVLDRPSPEALAELPLLAAAGHTSLKVFMTFSTFETHAAEMIAAIKVAGELGMLTLIHCEDGALVRFAGEQLLASGRGRLADWAESRPELRRAGRGRAGRRDLRGHRVAHLHRPPVVAAGPAVRSPRAAARPAGLRRDPAAVPLPDQRRAEGAAGRPVYRRPAAARAGRPGGAVGGLADGSVHTVGSDHAPWSLRDKIDESLDVTTARQGVADLETMLPMLFSEGVRAGRISLDRFIALTSANPARLFGLYPRKGTIAVGSDADLVVLDPKLRRTIDGRSMRSNADYSVYDGREVYGWPRFTVSRGEIVLEDGQVVAEPGRGQWLRRGRTTAP